MSDVQKAMADLTAGWAEFKAANDANEKQRDVLLEDKMQRIEKTVLDKVEPLNQQLTAQAKAVDTVQKQLDHIETVLNRPGATNSTDKDSIEARSAFDRLLRKPAADRSKADLDILTRRVAALVKSDDSGAGYLLAPPDLQAEIIKDVVEATPIRAHARVVTIGGDSLKQPRRTGTGGATRVGERTPRTNTGDPAYGMITINAPELFARFEVSQTMMEDSAYDLLAELRLEAAEQFAVREGAEFVSGTGKDQAEGILTASGIAETVSGNATGLTGDGIIDLCYGLKASYARNAVFGLNRQTLGAVRKLKDGDGNYLWLPGLVNGLPNTILGAPYVEMSEMPAVAAGSYPIFFGDLRRSYVVVDRISMAVSVDFTTGADDGLVILRARKRTGGAVVLPAALRKLKIAA